VAARYVLGAEIYKFAFPLNAGILNRWQRQPLVMAGMWVPDDLNAEDNEPSEAVDALAELVAAEDVRERTRGAELRPLMEQGAHTADGSAAFFGGVLLNEDEALRIILQSSSAASSSTCDSPGTGSRATSAYGSPSVDCALYVQRMRERRRRDLGDAPATPPVSVAGTPVSSEHIGPSERSAEDLRVEVKEADVEHEDTKSIGGQSTASNIMNSSISSAFSIYKRETSNASAAQDLDGISVATAEEEEADSGLADDKRSSGSDEAMMASMPPSKSAAEMMADAIEEEERAKRSLRTARATDSTRREEGGILAIAARRASSSNKVEVARPPLAGFIENFKPFSNRFFDTPPKPPKLTKARKKPSFSSGLTENQREEGWLSADASVGGLNVADTRQMLSVFDKVMTELGLDRQNYECAGCSRAIGSLFGPAKLCAYTKLYYCQVPKFPSI